MRITFLVPIADMSGGARVISLYARELAKRGHEVAVIVARGPRPTWRARLRRLLWREALAPTGRRASHYDAIGSLVHRLDRLGPIRAADCPDADVVVATWWETAEWMMALPAAKGRRVHFVQGYEAFSDATKPRVDAVLRLATRKITISRWLGDLLAGTFGNTDVHLVHNGVDTNQFDAPPRGRAAAPTVGILYNTAPFKNVDLALRAFARLRAERGDARLVAFGTGEVSAAHPLPPSAVYHRLPAQDAIRAIYAACDVWLVSSTNEGFCLPMLEAMACRCPVVSTPVGGPLEIIEEGANGFLVPFDDVDAMTARLVRFFDLDEAAWRRLSDGAYRTAQAHDWARAVDRFEEALRG